jgi:hypothetical protein
MAGWATIRQILAAKPVPRTSLDRVIGPARDLALIRSDIDLIKEIAHSHDATVKDVLLEVIAGGLRGLFRNRGEPVEDLVLPVYVPVTLRQAQARAQARGNLVGQMVVPLPIGVPDPGRRLALIAAVTATRKAESHPSLGAAFRSRTTRRVLLKVLDRYPVVTGQVHLVPQQATSARSGCRLASLAVLIDWCELEYRVAVCLGDEILHWRVLGRQEIPSGGGGDAGVLLEDGPGLFGSNLADGVFMGVAPAGQGHPPGRTSVVYPGHRAIGGDQPASPVVRHWDHGVGARSAGLAALGGQQVRPGHQARSDERAHDRVLNVAAAAGTVLPRWPGTHTAPLLPARPAVSGFLARFCGGHGLPPSAGCIGLGASPACYRCRNGSRIA